MHFVSTLPYSKKQLKFWDLLLITEQKQMRFCSSQPRRALGSEECFFTFLPVISLLGVFEGLLPQWRKRECTHSAQAGRKTW